MTEIIVYRNPAEAALWQMLSGGEFFPVFAGAIVGTQLGAKVTMSLRFMVIILLLTMSSMSSLAKYFAVCITLMATLPSSAGLLRL